MEKKKKKDFTFLEGWKNLRNYFYFSISRVKFHICQCPVQNWEKKTLSLMLGVDLEGSSSIKAWKQRGGKNKQTNKKQHSRFKAKVSPKIYKTGEGLRD